MELIEQKQGSVMTVAFKGRLDASNSAGVQDRIVAIIDQGEHRLVLDLSGLDYISSAGLRVLLVAAKKLKIAAGKIALCGLQPSIREIFEIAGFIDMFPIAATRADAIASIGS
ncbi:MAG TPA: STAS domain-containing protein [Verrucomicrobiae bacterium]|nr:STAS domain-containing protein [Verrucomicrobiae bacterium]